MDDCISCGKSSLLLTSDQQEHLLLLRGVDDQWTGHSSWTHSSVRESVISSAGWSCISHTHTTLSEVYVKKKKKKEITSQNDPSPILSAILCHNISCNFKEYY